MTSKIKNAIIFLSIGTVFVLSYLFFFRSSGDTEATLISSSGPTVATTEDNTTSNPSVLATREFLSLLLSIKTIKLDDTLLKSDVFASLHDSSVILTPDGTEGRPNPFALFGNDEVLSTQDTPNATTPSSDTSGVNAPANKPLPNITTVDKPNFTKPNDNKTP